jgi:hypothetical protein
LTTLGSGKCLNSVDILPSETRFVHGTRGIAVLHACCQPSATISCSIVVTFLLKSTGRKSSLTSPHNRRTLGICKLHTHNSGTPQKKFLKVIELRDFGVTANGGSPRIRARDEWVVYVLAGFVEVPSPDPVENPLVPNRPEVPNR